MNNSGKIVNLVNPANNQDAATKSYVDTKTTDMATTTAVSTAISTALGGSGTQTNYPTIGVNTPNQPQNYYLTYSLERTGRATLNNDDELYYNPSTNTLTAGTFSGSLSGSAISAANISNPSDATFTTGGGERMRITSDGRIGIGTTSPQCPLHVLGGSSNAVTGGTGRYWSKDGGSSTTSASYSISIIADAAIWLKGEAIFVTSDQRIKTNIVNLNADKMINVFRSLRPISFDFIDPMKTNNNKKHFGFIAQEVNEVLPEGISLNSDVIPNNMMKANIAKPIETDEEPHFTLKPTDTITTLQYLLLTTDTPLIFDISNSYSSTDTYKFKVYCGDKWTKEHDIYIRSDYNVTDDKYTYVIGLKKEAYDVVMMEPTLFVYGQYVNDLHILDHDTIYTVATAALQEVDRQQQADKARIAELEATVAQQQSLINDILERLKKVEKA